MKTLEVENREQHLELNSAQYLEISYVAFKLMLHVVRILLIGFHLLFQTATSSLCVSKVQCGSTKTQENVKSMKVGEGEEK